MKKMIKLSLVAAVAVAGLTTNAAAGSLEDAIKDTSVSGKVLVGFNNKVTNAGAGAQDATSNEIEYDLDIKFKSKVNDMVTAVVGFQADHENKLDDSNTTDSTKGGDTMTLTNAHFVAKTDMVTVIAGKQKVGTPFLDDDRGDGVVALIPAGPVTVAAAHFVNTNAASGALANVDVSAAALIGSFGPVNLTAWALQTSIIDGLSINVNGTFGPVTVDANYASTTADADGSEKESLTKVIVSGKIANFSVLAGYGMTNDTTAARGNGVDLTSDNDAANNFALDITRLDSYNDASAMLIGAGASFGSTSVDAKYLVATIDGNGGVDTDATELNIAAAYKMSKNFSVTGLYAAQEIDNNAGTKSTDDRMELSLNYKF